MNGKLNKLADMLLELERELRRLERWSFDEPTPEQLQSTAPFAADRLAMEEWLQWIFIPAIKQIIESDSDFPEICDIHPYAEEYLKHESQQPEQLLNLIREIDRFITRN